MRVLFWSGTFWPQIGGVEVLATKLLQALSQRGHEFMVVTGLRNRDLPRKAHYQGIPVHRLQLSPEPDRVVHQLMEVRQQIADLKRAFAPDLVHINAVSASNFFHLTTADAHPARMLVTLHDERRRDDEAALPVGDDRLIGRLLRAADWVSCVSAAVLTEVSRQLPEILPRSSVIHNALDLPSLPPLPLPVHAPRLLCLGRLVARKGFDVALSAFALIAHRFPDARLMIAGDGPARRALEKQAAELRVAPRIDFLGWVAPEDVPALMNTATLVVMPSRREPFGLVALDAAQMARPIIATRVGGLPEVVVHGQTGLLVKHENVPELADALSMLLEHPEVAIRMGQAARNRAIESFGWERCVDAYDALYRRLVQDADRRACETDNR